MTENGTSAVDRAREIVQQFIHISARFKILSKLQGGYKLWVTTDPDTGTKIFSIDNSYIPSVSRWLYSQNRDEIINTIIEDIDYINHNHMSMKTEGRNKLATLIEKAMPGLKNMKETYKGDEKHEERINYGINILNTIMNELKKTH